MNRFSESLPKISLNAVATLTTAFLLCAPVVAPAPALAAKPAPAATPPAAATPANVPAEVRQAVAALRAIATMRADFTQLNGNGQRTTGVLTLKRPGKIRFQYAPGVPMLIVGDGRALTVVDTELKQSQRWPIGSSPLGALLDPGKDVTRFGTLLPAFEPGVISIEVRDRGHPEFGVITLVLTHKASAPGGLELSGWSTLDSQSRRTVIRLANHRYGIDAPDEMFRYTDLRVRPHH